ncbi:transposase [Nocardia sp. CA-107356]|uniref:transposase n=1 Tax=Nocardia sp. CA-107356 TaxID=3239972 RepID=UPI003D8E864B
MLVEVGIDMSRFPTVGHLCCWATVLSGHHSSAGRTKPNAATGHGNRHLARVLGETAGCRRQRRDTEPHKVCCAPAHHNEH